MVVSLRMSQVSELNEFNEGLSAENLSGIWLHFYVAFSAYVAFITYQNDDVLHPLDINCMTNSSNLYT